jgi:hypothetical protein
METIKDKATSIWDKAKSFGSAIWDKAKSIGGAVWDKAKSVGGFVWDKVKAGGAFILNKVKGVLGKAFELIGKFMPGSLKSVVTKIIPKVFTGLKTIGSKIPIASLLTTGYNVYNDIKNKNWAKAAYDLTSGALSMVPGIGTLASLLMQLASGYIFDENKKEPVPVGGDKDETKPVEPATKATDATTVIDNKNVEITQESKKQSINQTHTLANLAKQTLNLNKKVENLNINRNREIKDEQLNMDVVKKKLTAVPNTRVIKERKTETLNPEVNKAITRLVEVSEESKDLQAKMKDTLIVIADYLINGSVEKDKLPNDKEIKQAKKHFQQLVAEPPKAAVKAYSENY